MDICIYELINLLVNFTLDTKDEPLFSLLKKLNCILIQPYTECTYRAYFRNSIQPAYM